jgi:hypothetical protein
MTVRPPTDDIKLPQLVRKSRRALEQEALGLKAALAAYATATPMAGCPYQADTTSAKHAPSRVRKAQQNLLALGQQQARLMFINAYDHLVSMGRLLGSDGAMSLFAHVTLSRSVCEAAIRHAWLLDPAISYEERITRSAAVLFGNAENRLKGARESLANLDVRIAKPIIDKCVAEYEEICRLIGRAGMDLARDRNGKKIARVELRETDVKVPIKLDIGPLVLGLLPESPGWYTMSSGTAHSGVWMLDSAVLSGRGGSELELTPDLLELASAAETAISASALLIDRHGTYFGFDPEPYMRKSRQRRAMLDTLMREQAARQVTNPAPLVPAAQ